MPAVLSKFYYEPELTGYKVGGTDEGDYHIWVENEQGEVVFDPAFNEYEFICRVRGADISKPVRHKWGNQKSWLDKKSFTYLSEGNTRQIIADMFSDPRYQHCRNNAIAYLYNKGKEGDKAVIGSMGWQTISGDYWWEFG